MTLVQVFGNNGSGKTTLLRDLVGTDPEIVSYTRESSFKPGKKLTFTRLPRYRAVLVGEYVDRTQTTAGVDRLSPKPLILEALDMAVDQVGQLEWEYVVWEGIIIMTRQYHPEYVKRGLNTRYVFLDIDPETCIRRVLARSGKAPEDLKGGGDIVRRRHKLINNLRTWAHSVRAVPGRTHRTTVLDATQPASRVLRSFYLDTFFEETRIA